MAKETAGQRN